MGQNWAKLTNKGTKTTWKRTEIMAEVWFRRAYKRSKGEQNGSG